MWIRSSSMASKLSIRRAQVHVPNTCTLCDSIQNVNWYCNDCQEAMCDKCKEVHQRGKKTRNDDIVPMKEANKHGEAVLPEVCKIHPGKTCDLFCTECHVEMCSMCFTQKHKQHAFKHIEEEIDSQKQYMREQLNTLKSMLDHFNDNISTRHGASKTFKESVDVIRKDAQAQGSKLKAEVDLIVDAVLAELSNLVSEENKTCRKNCQTDEKNVTQIKQLIREVEEQTENRSSTTLFELNGKIRTAIPLDDVAAKSVLPTTPSFVIGQLNITQLKAMIGHVQTGYEKDIVFGYKNKKIDSQHVQQISTFRVLQHNQIMAICPIDDTHAWMSVYGSTDLILIDKTGYVTEANKLDFEPFCLALTNTAALLITNYYDSPLIHKILENRRVATFADVSPLKARNISVRDSDEVFVTTDTPTILVLNMSGDKVRQLSCGQGGRRIVCLTTGNVAVTTSSGKELIFIDKSDHIINKWSGELDSGQKISQTRQWIIARDIYDRVFVPDYDTNQVYVLPGNERKAKRLLAKKHGVTRPTAVCVDKYGHVWIGCYDGTVHVMQL